MKKIISVLLVLVLLLPLCAIAEKTETEKKNAFEFCDMYMYRLQQIKDKYGLDATHDLTHYFGYMSYPFIKLSDKESIYFAEVPAGTLLVSVPDFSVYQLDVKIMDLNDEDTDGSVYMFRAAAAFAALEYDRFDEMAFNIVKTNSTGVIYEAIEKISAILNDSLSDKKVLNQLLSKSGSGVQVYTGNYKYSLQYNNFEVDGHESKYLSLVAECK